MDGKTKDREYVKHEGYEIVGPRNALNNKNKD
jgi:hypothetical protein